MTTATLTRFESDVQSYFTDLTDAQVVKLCDELDAYGINTFEQFEDALAYTTDSGFRAQEEFAEYIYCELGCNEIDDILEGCIDWQVVWDTAYRFDFFELTDGENVYFFFNQ